MSSILYVILCWGKLPVPDFIAPVVHGPPGVVGHTALGDTAFGSHDIGAHTYIALAKDLWGMLGLVGVLGEDVLVVAGMRRRMAKLVPSSQPVGPFLSSFVDLGKRRWNWIFKYPIIKVDRRHVAVLLSPLVVLVSHSLAELGLGYWSKMISQNSVTFLQP